MTKGNRPRRYVWVNPDRLTKGRTTRDVDGIRLVVEVSPYSVPKAISGSYDCKNGQFVIDFKYIDDEAPRTRENKVGDLLIKEGRFSRKILSISIPVDNPDLQSVGIIDLQTRISKAFRERIKDVNDLSSPDVPDVLNQDVAEEILDSETLKELVSQC